MCFFSGVVIILILLSLTFVSQVDEFGAAMRMLNTADDDEGRKDDDSEGGVEFCFVFFIFHFSFHICIDI